MGKNFTLVYWSDNGGFVGKIEEVDGVFSQGETLDELEANIREVFSLVFEGQRLPDQLVKTQKVM
ncbi:MAG: type II toxin-antitoxin system HicB family antitoxin [Candidatus Riflebacteria bacterium]